jgi:hypothetical protein
MYYDDEVAEKIAYLLIDELSSDECFQIHFALKTGLLSLENLFSTTVIS